MAGAILLLCGASSAADRPTPTPTPRTAGGKSLHDVAKDKKLKGDTKESSSGSIVISNENLSDYAAQGGLTTAKPETKGTGTRGVHAGTAVRVVDAESAAEQQKKFHWQDKYRQQLERIAAIKYQLAELDYEIPGLWNDYYSRDDPAYRDSVIKPKLDKALERHESLQKLLLQEEPKLAQIKEDARKDGAEPGWFREIKAPTPRPKQTGPDGAIEITDRGTSAEPQ
jgi:hypothetical protein